MLSTVKIVVCEGAVRPNVGPFVTFKEPEMDVCEAPVRPTKIAPLGTLQEPEINSTERALLSTIKCVICHKYVSRKKYSATYQDTHQREEQEK